MTSQSVKDYTSLLKHQPKKIRYYLKLCCAGYSFCIFFFLHVAEMISGHLPSPVQCTHALPATTQPLIPEPLASWINKTCLEDCVFGQRGRQRLLFRLAIPLPNLRVSLFPTIAHVPWCLYSHHMSHWKRQIGINQLGLQ